MISRYRILLVACLAQSWSIGQTQILSIPTDKGDYRMYDSSKALIIGMSKYKPWPVLEQVSDDMVKVQAALTRQGFGEITVAPDLPREQLRSRIRSFLVQPVKRDTRLVLYFAGHGWTDGRHTGYLVPTDNPEEGDPGFRDYLVGMDDISNWSKESKAKHVLMVFDSCFSGAVFLSRSNQKPVELLLQEADQPVRQFITSGSATEQVPDQSDFVEKFVSGLDGAADIDGDGVITANELGNWLKKEITKLGKQTPQYGSSQLREYKRGNLLFQIPSIPKGARKFIPVKAIGDGRSRESISARGIGLPDDESLTSFRGVDILYYQKIADGTKIGDALDAQRIPYSKTRASLPQSLETNAIACSPDVPVAALQRLALSLLEAGVRLKAILPFADPRAKPPLRLEIMTTQFTKGSGLRARSADGITRDQIASLKGCPL